MCIPSKKVLPSKDKNQQTLSLILMWALTDCGFNRAKLSVNMTRSGIFLLLPRVIGLNASSFVSQISESEEALTEHLHHFLPPDSDLRVEVPAVHACERSHNLQEDVSWIGALASLTEACLVTFCAGAFKVSRTSIIWDCTWNLNQKGKVCSWSSKGFEHVLAAWGI